jgi:nitroimidazol reductase NimA-like FMN-containing flavoprotein (pyridoxamine 5'-phosphate oxidase superfamily)
MSTARTRITRLREKGRSERADLDAILDSVHVGHFGLIGSDGEARVMPTAVVRDGDDVLIHGSTGSPWLQLLADGVPTCLTVTAFDGLVVARSAFESSIHYRSATLFGRCRVLHGAAKVKALDLVTNALLPGRVEEIRRPTERELAATIVLALALVEWSVKVSADWPDDPDEDVAGDAWAGVVPRRTSYGAPTPAPDLRRGVAVPESVARLSAGDAGASRAP